MSTSARYHSKGRLVTDDYEVYPHKVLGEGCSGAVVLARGRLDGRKYALKKISTKKVKDKAALQQLASEVEIYLALDHPHIAALHDVYETDKEIMLLTEYCEGGELYAKLYIAGTYTESDAAHATREMLLSIGYLHAHSIVHRDLKLENFLYTSRSPGSPLKLIDFGFAKLWDPSTLMMATCGSIAYVSPDVLRGHGYTSKCDLWSLGVIVFMLLAGYPPFHGSDALMRGFILHGKVDWSHKRRWKHVSANAIDFVRSLLTWDPSKRLDAQQALRHRWIVEVTSQGGAQPVLSKDSLRALRRYVDSSRLRRAVLQLLARELTQDDVSELRRTFLHMDRTGEGTVRLAELKDAIRGVREGGELCTPAPSGCTSPVTPKTPKTPKTPASACATPAARLRRAKSGVISELFDVLDQNGDEQIYYSDFLAATMPAKTTEMQQRALRSAFRRFDVDNRGTICTDDLKKVMGESFEGVSVELLFGDIDRGGKGEVGYSDFLRVLDGSDPAPTLLTGRSDAADRCTAVVAK